MTGRLARVQRGVKATFSAASSDFEVGLERAKMMGLCGRQTKNPAVRSPHTGD